MAINYQEVLWDTTKYVNPTNMNQMDSGIKSACDGVDEMGESITTISGDVETLQTDVGTLQTNLGQPSEASAVSGNSAFSKITTINNKIGNKFIVVTGTTAESGGNVMTPYPNGCNKNNIVILGCQVQRQDSLDWRSLGVAQWGLDDDNKPLPRRMFCWAGDDGIGFHTSSVGREEGNPFNNAPFKITLMRTDI